MWKQLPLWINDKGQMRWTDKTTDSLYVAKPNGYSVVLLTSHHATLRTFLPNPAPDIFVHIDHVDGCRDNNTLSNLRWITPQLNHLNRKNTKGYYKRKNRYVVKVCNQYIALFKSPEKAHDCYMRTRAALFDHILNYWNSFISRRAILKELFGRIIKPKSLIMKVDARALWKEIRDNSIVA